MLTSIACAKRASWRTLPAVGALLAAAIWPQGDARASRELPLAYDARSAAMGGTGTAFAQPGVGAAFNPALISQTLRLHVTATFTPNITRIQAPFPTLDGRGVQELYGKTGFGPLGQLGASVRLHDRLVIGVNAQIPSAIAGTYENVPAVALLRGATTAATAALPVRLQRQLLVGTLTIPVAIEVADWLSVAGAYRMSLYADAQDAALGPQTVLAARASAKNFGGADVGVLVKPHQMVQVGIAYQTQVRSDIKVKPKGGGETVTQKGAFVEPHRFRVGVAVRPLGERLLVAGDFRYALDRTADAKLRDSFGGHLGAEYFAAPHVPVRIGGSVGRTSTLPTLTSASDLPSGSIWSVGTGAGYKLSQVDLDGAFAYVRAGGQDGVAVPPGAYISQGYVISISATYHI